jgi:hypothetical protein
VAGSRPGGQYVQQAPKVMRHQQLKQGPGYTNHYSPKHGNREGRCVWPAALYLLAVGCWYVRIS